MLKVLYPVYAIFSFKGDAGGGVAIRFCGEVGGGVAMAIYACAGGFVRQA